MLEDGFGKYKEEAGFRKGRMQDTREERDARITSLHQT